MDLDPREMSWARTAEKNRGAFSAMGGERDDSGHDYIYIGATEVDSSGYPDCRKSYFKAYNQLIAQGTKPETDIRIITPIIDFNKKNVVEKGLELNAPLHLTWSCYKKEKIACGKCDSCILRLKGFREAGAKDPILYEE
jgi:7-cyano-7-deazaguanine synthase